MRRLVCLFLWTMGVFLFFLLPKDGKGNKMYKGIKNGSTLSSTRSHPEKKPRVRYPIYPHHAPSP